MFDRIATSVIAHPWRYIVFFVLVTLALGTQLPRSQMDSAMKTMLPADMPTRQSLDKIAADMERDFYMSPEEAKTYGLIDQVIAKRG